MASINRFLQDPLSLGSLLPNLLGSKNAKKWLLTTAPMAAAGAYLLHRWVQSRDLPPGPAGLPVLGRVPWTDMDSMHLTMLKECNKYGDICSFYLGSRLFIVVNSYTLMKEMLDDPVFAGKPQVPFLLRLTRGCGILIKEGDQWSHHRCLSLKSLRNEGFERMQTIEMIDEQLDIIFECFDEFADSSAGAKVVSSFLLASNSIITEMTLGHRFERNDLHFRKVNGYINDLLKLGLFQSPPFLYRAVELLVSILPMTNKRIEKTDFVHEFIKNEVRKRQKIMEIDGAQPECLCDTYLQEKRKAEKAGDFETFKECQIIRVCFEMYLAGTDTTARSMEWLLLYMAFYPDVQDRVQKELDSVIGQSRRPRMQDKTELHYTCAVIDEVYRKASLVATGVFHRAVEDTTFHGYRIPSNAVIMPLVYGVHHRPDYWKKPDEFYPEHFLDDNGRYRSSSYLIPFLIGRRSCVGESLARMEIFLFFTAIMQRYRVRPEPECVYRKEEILSGRLGAVRIPAENRLIISRR